MTVFYKTEVYKVEYMPVNTLHALVNHTEWELRVEISSKPGKDLERVKLLVAKLKFLTWATLFPCGPDFARIEIDWAEFVDFLERADALTDFELGHEVHELMPEYMYWLQHGNFYNGVPEYEVWDQYACI